MSTEPRRKHASQMTHDEFVEALRRAQLDPTPVDTDNLKLSPLPEGQARVYFNAPRRRTGRADGDAC